MLNIQDAINIANENIPNGKIQAVVTYRGLYLFQIFTDDPYEGDMDPFYSVDQQTGEFRDFSIITDGDISEIVPLFEEALRKANRSPSVYNT